MIITNLKDAKLLKIGEHFIYGSYAKSPIEWIKVSDDSAIAACLLERKIFGQTNNYEKSRVRIWCNELCEKLGLLKDTIYIPHEHEIIECCIGGDVKVCDYSKELQECGVGYGPSYWLQTEGIENSNNLRYVHVCIAPIVDNIYDSSSHSCGGVRPALKLD